MRRSDTRVEERIGGAKATIKHCSAAEKRRGFELGAVKSTIKSPVRLAGGHQFQNLAWRDRSERSIISEVTKVCGRVEKGHGWE